MADKVGVKLYQDDDQPVAYGGRGPHGYGDPKDNKLRKVEREVSIPRLMKKNAQKICKTECQAFNECGKKHGLMLPFRCREENSKMNTCIEALFKDQKFWDSNTQEYLDQRRLFRLTGLSVSDRKLMAKKEIEEQLKQETNEAM